MAGYSEEIRDFLEENCLRFNQKSFIENDPVCIPHLFTKKEDIEIAGFLAATIAWGNRKSIISSASQLMEMMDNSPHEFICNHSKKDLRPLEKFYYRTFNGTDCVFFIKSLRHLYQDGGLERAFAGDDAKERISNFRKKFLATPHALRSEKHVSDPLANSAAKRLCMFLRWMVRRDKKGVDFGLWKSAEPAELCLPLDVHTGNISRALGLLARKQNDWKAVEEITSVLRHFDPQDPVKYDFALFGAGVEKLIRI